MIVLGIETSCDETTAVLVTHDKHILSNILSSQDVGHKVSCLRGHYQLLIVEGVENYIYLERTPS